MPFEDAGYVITGYYETNESPYPHGPNDVLANMDPAYVTEISKGAVAAALYFAKVRTAYLTLNHNPITTSQDTLNPYNVNVVTVSSSAINTAKCYYQVNNIGFNELNMSLISSVNDTMIYSTAIPSQSYNSVIDYYFEFENTDSVLSRLPQTPGTYYQFVITPDTVAPVLSHTVLQNQSYMINPIEFTIHSNDENDIANTWLYLKINNGMEQEFEMAAIGNDEYSYLLTDSLSHSDSIFYRFKAIDNSANHNESWLPSNGYFAFELLNSELFSFEYHNNLFNGNGDWQWGELTDISIPNPEEDFVWATSLSGNYSANSSSELLTPYIDLSGKSDVKMVISHYYQIEPNNDGGNIKLSTDGLNFQVIHPILGYPFTNLYLFNEPGYSGNSYYWVENEFDLSAYSNQQIQIKLDFRSDVFTQQKGWYIDYMRLDFRGAITNHAPQIVQYFPQHLDTLLINAQQTFSIAATDPDNDSLAYSITYKNQVILDSVATFTFSESGIDTVIALVQDGKGKLDMKQWMFHVNDPASSINPEGQLVSNYNLYPPTPNPFNPETKILYEVKEAGNIEINVYNISGQKISTLRNGFSAAGTYTVKLSGAAMPSGIYIIEMKAKNYYATQKAFLIK
jgi:hypothetical protein